MGPELDSCDENNFPPEFVNRGHGRSVSVPEIQMSDQDRHPSGQLSLGKRGTEMAISEVLQVGSVFAVLFWAFGLRRRNAMMQPEVAC
jgi:hypothetical protein